MKLTRQQALVLFDIAKGCLYDIDRKQFAGYSKEDIGRLLNDIIKQQDNSELLELSENSMPKMADLSNIKPGKLYETGKVDETPDKTKGLQDVTHKVLNNMSNSDEDSDFWDD